MKFLILLALLVISTAAWQATIYEHSGHRGVYQSYWTYGCLTLPTGWQDQASSIDTHGTCVTIYEHAECRGYALMLMPDTTCRHHLGECGMNDNIRSLGPC